MMDNDFIIEEEAEQAGANDQEQATNKNGLLQTIRVPANLAQLTKRLPKSNYQMHNQFLRQRTDGHSSKQLGVTGRNNTSNNTYLKTSNDQKARHTSEPTTDRYLPQINSMKQLEI